MSGISEEMFDLQQAITEAQVKLYEHRSQAENRSNGRPFDGSMLMREDEVAMYEGQLKRYKRRVKKLAAEMAC